MSDKDGGQAFPMASDGRMLNSGMTLRDYFAAQAAPGYIAAMLELSKVGKGPNDDNEAARISAHKAYALADAMLEARKR